MTLNKDYMAIELYPCNKITAVKPIFRIAGIIVNLTFTPIHLKTHQYTENRLLHQYRI